MSGGGGEAVGGGQGRGGGAMTARTIIEMDRQEKEEDEGKQRERMAKIWEGES